MATIACSSVGAGGSVADQGSIRNGRRWRKFCHIAAAVSCELTMPVTAKFHWPVITPTAKEKVPSPAAKRSPTGGFSVSPEDEVTVASVTALSASERANTYQAIATTRTPPTAEGKR